MLKPDEVELLRKKLIESKNPLFFFDDDADGLASFLLLYRYLRNGHGIVVKSSSKLEKKFLRKVKEFQPDIIFVLDLPFIEEDFIAGVKEEIIWIDHHPPQPVKGRVLSFNPRKHHPQAYFPTSFLSYQITQQDKWICLVGCLGDGFLPDFAPEFVKGDNAEEIIYNSPFHQLIQLFNFVLKGKSDQVNRCVKALTKINSPEELWEGKTPAARFLLKRFKKIKAEFDVLLEEAKSKVPSDWFLVFIYQEKKHSFTSDLSNYLLHLFPGKVVLVGRYKSGSYKCSLRARKPILKILEKALTGLDAFGGGHESACGVVIKKNDFDLFLKRFKEEYLKAYKNAE